jgi:ribosomal protein S18 acetylase RimI-like enzyme
VPDHVLRPFRPDDASAIHLLHAEHAAADLVDARATIEPPPDPDGVRHRMATADWAVVALDAAGSVVGWGSLRSWTEDDGTHASTVQDDRAALLERGGYRHVFSLVEMEHDGSPVRPRPLPDGVTGRAAVVADARPLHALTARVWAGRQFFELPTEEQLRDWLRRSELALFKVATVGDRLVGFVAVRRGPEIEDVQVDPGFQRRGLASALITQTLAGLAEREAGPVRLHTEGHDPAGARSLYERLGFQAVREYRRYRKPLSG